ncbi:hypothetical protein COCOBI_11-2680 [Coccomyxa sp. Obi]|nr:hypothetical protein COCOBI_11-2680 [Coccomyxa sp. Obi]
MFMYNNNLPRWTRAGDIRRLACRAATTEAIEDELVGEDAQRWRSSVQRLHDLGFDEEEAEKILRKAFGWAGQGYWRKSKVKEIPSDGQVDSVVSFLTEDLRLKEADITKAVKKFPEVFGLDVESQMKANVEKLKKDWKMTDKVIPNVVKRQPQVLGYNVDCEGNCMGECNRCWIRL